MDQIHRSKKPAHFNDDEESVEIGEENSFEGENKIFELKSEIHSLQIEKNRIALEHQSLIVGLEEANEHLTTQYNSLRRENTKYVTIIKKLEDEVEELKGICDSYRLQENNFRRIQNFHHVAETESSFPRIEDPSNVMNELVQKDKIIEEMRKKLSNFNQQSVRLVDNSVGNLGEDERFRYEEEIKNLKSCVDDLKNKEIIEKREYEIMIQTKDEIIRKMSTQNDELSSKLGESMEKIVTKLKAEIEQLENNNNANLEEINFLKQNLKTAQNENHKIKTEFKRKEETLLVQYEAEKEDLTRVLNEKLKKHLKEKEEKVNKSEEALMELENELVIARQENGRLKAEIGSLNKLNEYLSETNREYEECKKNLQLSLYCKEKEASEMKQKHFLEMSQANESKNKDHQVNNQIIENLTLDLLEKNTILKQYQQNNAKTLNFNHEFDKVSKEKETLEAALVALENRYEEKSQKLLNIEKKIRKEYEERINGLETELISSRQNQMNENEKTRDPTAYDKSSLLNEKELQKAIGIGELRSLEIEDKQRELQHNKEEKIKIERENEELKSSVCEFERKLKEKTEQHKNLEICFEELGEKYRKGVKELEIKIEEMKEEVTEERKKGERRKLEAYENEENLTEQIKKYKHQIKQLEGEVSVYQNQKVSQAEETDLKLQTLAYQIESEKKEKEEAIKVQDQKNKQKELSLLEANNKLQEYVDQLEENMSALTKKFNVFELKEKKSYHSVEKELRQVKMEYSEALSEMNDILQKYRKLEDCYRQTLSGYQRLKDERENLNIKYLEVYNERSRVANDLNSAYDQINKLNTLLMSKEDQRHKNTHSLEYSHYNPKYSQNQNHLCYLTTTNLGFNRIPSPKFCERNQPMHNLQNSSKFSKYC